MSPTQNRVLRRFVALCLLMFMGSNGFSQEEDPPFVTSDTNVGYIDSAIPATQVRLRFDAAFDNPTPDRSEFLYRASTAATGAPISPAEPRVDYQDVTTYLEWAFTPLWSVFFEAPFRMINPELNANNAGFGDLRLGVKGVLWMDQRQLLSGQLRTFVPTGDADKLLGTEHSSVEPALLYARRLSDLTMLESELRVWVPIDGTTIPEGEFAGPIVRYGIGLGHDLFYEADHCHRKTERLTLVTEFVGWTVLDGFATVPANPTMARLIDADGDTIINGKCGLRWTDAERSLYLGYGRALTGDVWYRDIVRAEYAIRF